MSNLPWVRFFPSDWLSGTRGMSLAESGLYITLIAMMYDHQKPLGMDALRLSRLCGASLAEFTEARDALIESGHIIVTEAGLWNARVEREISARLEKSDTAKKSAEARWSKTTTKTTAEKCERINSAMRSGDICNANQKPEPELEDSSLRSLSAAPAPKREKRSSRLPADWHPDEAMTAHAASLGFTPAEIRIETEKIRDWSVNSPNGAKKDWAAAWRNWLKSALERKTQNAGRGRIQAEPAPFSSNPRLASAARNLWERGGEADPFAPAFDRDPVEASRGDIRDRNLAVFDVVRGRH